MELNDFLETKNLRQEVFKFYDDHPEELLEYGNNVLYDFFHYVPKEQRGTLRNYKKEYKQEHAKLKLSNFYRKKQAIKYIEREVKRVKREDVDDLEDENDEFDYDRDFSKEIEMCWNERKSDYNPKQAYWFPSIQVVKEIMKEIPRCPYEQFKNWFLNWQEENPDKHYFFF